MKGDERNIYMRLHAVGTLPDGRKNIGTYHTQNITGTDSGFG